jgi:hypothetical protein
MNLAAFVSRRCVNRRGRRSARRLRVAPARSYVVVRAADGYAAVFSLAELEIGPFRMLAPCDKTQARWAREVTGPRTVTISDTKTTEPS